MKMEREKEKKFHFKNENYLSFKPEKNLRILLNTVGWGYNNLRDTYFSPPLWLNRVRYFRLIKYSGGISLSDLFPLIFIVRILLRSPLLSFEVRSDVIFSQSSGDCPLIFCPIIPHPHCIGFFPTGAHWRRVSAGRNQSSEQNSLGQSDDRVYLL